MIHTIQKTTLLKIICVKMMDTNREQTIHKTDMTKVKIRLTRGRGQS